MIDKELRKPRALNTAGVMAQVLTPTLPGRCHVADLISKGSNLQNWRNEGICPNRAGQRLVKEDAMLRPDLNTTASVLLVNKRK